MHGAVEAQAVRRRFGQLHIRAPGAEPEPGVDLLQLERFPRQGGHIGVAGGIDHGAAGDSLAAGLRLDQEVCDVPAFAPNPDHAPVQPQVHTRLQHHSLCFDLELEGVVGDGVAHRVRTPAPDEAEAPIPLHERLILNAPFIGRRKERRPACGEAVDHLLAEAGDDLVAAPVVEGEQEDDEPVRCQPAERAVPLDEHGPRSAPGCCHCRRDPGCASSDDGHIDLGDDRRLPRGLGERSTLHRRYRTADSKNLPAVARTPFAGVA